MYGKLGANTGKCFSDEHKQKISATKKLKSKTRNKI